MNEKNITLFVTVILFSSVAQTQDDTTTASSKDTLGFGIGTLIGGLLAVPTGAIICAAGRMLFGDIFDRRVDVYLTPGAEV